MAVEISGLPATLVQANGKNTANATAQENNGQGNATSNVDVVTLTSQAAQIKAIAADISKQSAVDGNRVDNLKAAIDAGSYVIDPVRVAEKFIEFEFSLSA